jgi:hypothetical protein
MRIRTATLPVSSSISSLRIRGLMIAAIVSALLTGPRRHGGLSATLSGFHRRNVKQQMSDRIRCCWAGP